MGIGIGTGIGGGGGDEAQADLGVDRGGRVAPVLGHPTSLLAGVGARDVPRGADTPPHQPPHEGLSHPPCPDEAYPGGGGGLPRRRRRRSRGGEGGRGGGGEAKRDGGSPPRGAEQVHGVFRWWRKCRCRCRWRRKGEEDVPSSSSFPSADERMGLPTTSY